MRTSYSALGTFQQCPQKYKFQEIDKVKAPRSKEAVFGTLIHSSLKFLFSRDPLYPSLDEIVGHFRAGWQSSDMEISEDERSLYLSQGESILKRFYAKNQPWNFNVVDLESRFEVLMEDPQTKETHVLAGIMDRIDKPTDDTYEIIDYKTSRKMKSQEGADTDFQLSLYHMGLMRRWPHLPADNIILSLYYVKHNEKITTKRVGEESERMRERVLTLIRDIHNRVQTSDFPPQPSALCDWCGYKALCPAWKFLFMNHESRIINHEETKKNVAEYFALKKKDYEITKRLAELQADIKAYMEAEHVTRVFGDAGIISKTVQERYAYDYEKIKQAFMAHNRLSVWETLLTPDDKKLKTLVATLPSPLKETVLDARSIAKKIEVLTATKKNNKE